MIQRVVTPWGRLCHLLAPHSNWRTPYAACSAHGDLRALEWDETTRLPLCARCVARWRAHIEWQTTWLTEALDELEAQG